MAKYSEQFKGTLVSGIKKENHGIFIADGDFYATTLADKLDINKSGGWIRAGLAPYNTEDEVNNFIQAIQELVKVTKVNK